MDYRLWDTIKMVPMLLFVVFTTCFVGNHATGFESNHDLLMSMMSRLEMLEKKSEMYNQLFEENQLLRARIKDSENRITELTTKVKNLEKRDEYPKKEDDKHLQNQVEENFTTTDDRYDELGPNVLQTIMIAETKPRHKVKGNKKLEKQIQRRITPVSDQIAFYAYLYDNDQSNLPTHHTLVFDTVKLNRGLGYHADDGIFTVPRSGVYGFAWTVAVHDYSWASVELIVNGEVVGSAYAHAPTGMDFGTGFAIVHANAGDHAFIRMEENGNGAISSNARGKTSFSGWLLF